MVKLGERFDRASQGTIENWAMAIVAGALVLFGIACGMGIAAAMGWLA